MQEILWYIIEGGAYGRGVEKKEVWANSKDKDRWSHNGRVCVPVWLVSALFDVPVVEIVYCRPSYRLLFISIVNTGLTN
jgi:hypothetical protein